MENILIVLFWSLIGSVFSLIGGFMLIKLASRRETITRYALPFGAGSLLAAAFLGLLPEAMHGSDAGTALAWTLCGFLGFFLLERLLGWFHHHHHGAAADNTEARSKTHVALVVIGDTVHNMIDGIALGASFLVSIPTGIATAIAVAAHEIPHEIGDFGILLSKGMRPRRVAIVNLVSALATVVGAMAVYMLGSADVINPAPLLAITAGFFIYVAASDIIPDIHDRPHGEANTQSAMLIIGVLMLAWVISVTPHDHDHDTSGHVEHSHHAEPDHDH